MRQFKRKVDERLLIGRDVEVTPTDIDPTGVRLHAVGRQPGGPADGAPFDQKYELKIGGQCRLGGGHVTITLVAVENDLAVLGVLAPPNLDVQNKPSADAGR